MEIENKILSKFHLEKVKVGSEMWSECWAEKERKKERCAAFRSGPVSEIVSKPYRRGNVRRQDETGIYMNR